MFWRKLLKNLNKWKSFIIILLPFYFMSRLKIHKIDSQVYDKYKDIVEVISWLFAGILSLVAFATIFLAFIYENKLIIASKNLKRILKPYVLNTEELRLSFSEYQDSLFGDRTINILYYVYLLTAASSLLVWGTAVGLYTQYKVSFIIDFSVGSFLVFGIYLFFFILFVLFSLIAIAINLIRNYKNPLDKGFLPSVSSICDMDYIIDKKGDLKEFTKKNCPVIEIYCNPLVHVSKYELVFLIPIKVNNFRFVVTIFSSDGEEEALFKCYGILKEELFSDEVGRNFSCTVEKDFPRKLAEHILYNNCYGEIKIYNSECKLIARHVLKKESKKHITYFNYFIEAEIGLKDNDSNLIKKLDNNNSLFKWQQEKNFE
ncbi:hypothetical protein [Priestia megaterium]|uniref:hypothetical protein n=1 Tax=Priestia megaterium TaxID=1404 RepID=UPI00221E45DC|nr:hypothetical protein [Priestia megaterium]UYV50707.1 hypothetical protein OHU65_13965 [Priestia megaterium]